MGPTVNMQTTTLFAFTVLVAIFQTVSAAVTHPRHLAPRSLLHRIQATNPRALEFSGDSATFPGRKTPAGWRGVTVSPADLGGDPTGHKDSWEALNKAIGTCVNNSKPNGNFPGDTSFKNGHAIRDMGGCAVDLKGGEFLISKPLHIPEYHANMQFGRGSLVASKDFQGDFLLVIGIKGSCKVPQSSCNIDLNFPELFLDGSHVTSGMEINNVMGVTIGPGGYFLNFTQYGLQINGGHEVMMDRCWLGETNFDFDHEKFGRAPNATAIQINGNDHYISNTIVFSSKVGLEVNGAADKISGVHVWFPVNHALYFADSMAFHVTGGGNRFQGCYIDGGRAIFEERALVENVWTNGFECCAGAAPARGTSGSGIILRGDKVGPGLQITHNEFQGGTVYHEGTKGVAPTVTGVRIQDNYFGNSRTGKGTKATLTVTEMNHATSQWLFNFCDLLLFPNQISGMQVSVAATQGFPHAVARPPNGNCTVLVETAVEQTVMPITGSVTLTVDTSTNSPNFI